MIQPTEPGQSPVDKNRKLFFQIVLIFGIVGSALVPFINVFLKINNQSAIIDFFAFFLFIFILGLSGIKKFTKINYWIISIFSFAAVMGINYQVNGLFNVQNVSLLVIFPIIAIFFLGKRHGIFLSGLFVIANFIIIFKITNLGTAFQICFDICIAIFVLYFYELTQENSQKELAESVHQLTEQTEQLQKMNKIMIDRELVMIDLKKRIAELEKK